MTKLYAVRPSVPVSSPVEASPARSVARWLRAWASASNYHRITEHLPMIMLSIHHLSRSLSRYAPHGGQSALAALGTAAVLLHATATAAAEIKVLTAGAFKPVMTAVAADFEKQTGHKLVIDNDTAGGLVKRVNGGESFDVVIATPAALDAMAKEGKVPAGSAQALAKVGVGVAVKRGAPLPDISTVDAFKRALLDARAVAYIDPAAGGSSGIYIAQWFEKAGIADRIKPKAVLVPGGLVAQRLVNDQADLAIHQISEILAVPGAQLVGPIPAEIQNYTVYAGAISAKARDADAARSLLSALGNAKTREMMREKGMDAP